MSAALRKKHHAAVAALLREGSYEEAVVSVQEGLANFGPHVGLLSELVHATYLSGDVERFRRAMVHLETEFRSNEDKLSPASRIRTLLTLGKFFEEQARIADSFQMMEAATGQLDSGDPLSILVNAQKLRLLSSFGREADVANLYQLCLSVSEKNPDVWLEVFHALTLAEVRLFGFDFVWERFLAISRRTDLQAADLTLCLIDILEALLEKKNGEAIRRVTAWIAQNGIAISDAYEKEVLKLAANAEIQNSDLLRWTKLTPFARLRLLALSQRREYCPERQRQFLFLVQSLDHRSRKLLAAKWPDILDQGENLEPLLDLTHKAIRWKDSAASFSKSPMSWVILASFLNNPEVGTGELLIKLSKNGDSEQELESLRICVIRLNRKLAAMLGLSWVLRYSKTKITLHPQVRLKA